MSSENNVYEGETSSDFLALHLGHASAHGNDHFRTASFFYPKATNRRESFLIGFVSDTTRIKKNDIGRRWIIRPLVSPFILKKTKKFGPIRSRSFGNRRCRYACV